MADRELIPNEMPLDGRLITSVDPTLIGTNFQTLKNLRYTDTNIKGIKGMTKINSTVLAYPKIRNGFHFKKDQPSESHVLVQAYNSGETESKVYENTTAIPSTGDFNATALHTDTTGNSSGIFSESPGGNVAYCNGKDTMIWGGDEHFCSGFVNYDPDGDWLNDYTEKIQNTLTTSSNIATIKKVDGTKPATTGLLLHLNNNVTDSSATGHTVTNNNVTFTTDSKFGSHAAVFNGTNANLTIPDHADFDFSGGNFTIDFWMRLRGSSSKRTIFSQSTDANNYISLHVDVFGTLELEVYSAGSPVVSIGFYAGAIPNLKTGEWHHVEVVEDGDNWYIFVDGKLYYLSHIVDISRAANYTGTVYIGSKFDSTAYFEGDIDEFRIGLESLHTSNFEPRQVAYDTDAAYVYVGTTRPMKGLKFYVETANTTASSVKVLEWQRFTPADTSRYTTGTWVEATTVTDGTASGGISLAQTGSITFDDTKSTSSPRVLNNTHLYWYNFVFTDIDDTTQVSQCTVDMSFQSIKDLWDGTVRNISYFEVNTGSQAYDNTVNVFQGTYDSTNDATFSNIGALAGSGYMLFGFTERMTALDIRFVAGVTNTNYTSLSLLYWNGDQWTPLHIIQDGTFSPNKSLNKSGVITWTPPDIANESKQELGGRPPLYYYRITNGSTLSSNVKVYFVGGIAVQREINGYKFPLLSHDRLMLCSNQDDKKNAVLIGSPGTSSSFNGPSSREIQLGNDGEFIAGAELYGRFDSNVYKMTVLCKVNETWLLNELEDSNFDYYRVSDEIGCTAPLTMTEIHIPSLGDRGALHGAIWQSTDAIYFYDGKEFEPIHRDIEDVLTSINVSMVNRSVGFLDPVNDEWHYLIATGASTVLNEEWVFDLKRRKWFQIDRTKDLNCGFPVIDASGKTYTYGCIDTGYMERLENGTDFDGSDRIFTFRTGDMPLSKSIMYESFLRIYSLIAKAQNTTANTVTVTHYGDGSTTGTSMPAISAGEAGKRITRQTKSASQHKASVFHSLEFQITNNDDANGFEPLWLGTFYKMVRENRR